MQDTKKRILQVAERLFLEKGIEGASLRTITTEAKTNISAINYHFGGKENLVQEVFKKYLYPLDHIREEILKEAYDKESKDALAIKDLVRAFLIPWFEFNKKHPKVMSIFLKIYGPQTGVTNSYFHKMVAETAKSAYSIFHEGVLKALPEMDQIVLKKRMTMAAMTAASFILNGWLVKSFETLSDIKIEPEYLIDHITAVIEKGIID